MTELPGKSFPCFNPNDKVTAAPDGVGVGITVNNGLEITHAVLRPADARELGELLVALANAMDPPVRGATPA